MPASPDYSPTRFVILHHQLADGEHWDIMLERAGFLLTWQLPRNPLAPEALPMPARRIADHRTLYLTYEGSISGDRGSVRQVAAGAVEILEWTGVTCRFRLSESPLSGTYTLQRSPENEWTLEIANDGPRPL